MWEKVDGRSSKTISKYEKSINFLRGDVSE